LARIAGTFTLASHQHSRSWSGPLKLYRPHISHAGRPRDEAFIMSGRELGYTDDRADMEALVRLGGERPCPADRGHFAVPDDGRAKLRALFQDR